MKPHAPQEVVVAYLDAKGVLHARGLMGKPTPSSCNIVHGPCCSWWQHQLFVRWSQQLTCQLGWTRMLVAGLSWHVLSMLTAAGPLLLSQPVGTS
jgi:hypothetical protein